MDRRPESQVFAELPISQDKSFNDPANTPCLVEISPAAKVPDNSPQVVCAVAVLGIFPLDNGKLVGLVDRGRPGQQDAEEQWVSLYAFDNRAKYNTKRLTFQSESHHV